MTREDILFSLVMAALMSLFMSGIVTVANTGIDAGIIGRWMCAFYIACPSAFVALIILRPIASRITRILMGLKILNY
jgi:hypothetical protein